jgi:hypothetical protein
MTLLSYGKINENAEKYIKERFSSRESLIDFKPYNDAYIDSVTSFIGRKDFIGDYSRMYNSEKDSNLFTTDTNDDIISTIENSYSFVIALHNSLTHYVVIYLDIYKVLRNL